MPKISFLELVPKRPRTTVTIESENGPAEFDLTGVSLAELADIAKKFPSFLRVIEGAEGGMFSASEALPALIAAAFGHHGDIEYERQAARLPAEIVLALAAEIVKLTFPVRPSIALAKPEPAPEEEEAVSETRPAVISPLRLSS